MSSASQDIMERLWIEVNESMTQTEVEGVLESPTHSQPSTNDGEFQEVPTTTSSPQVPTPSNTTTASTSPHITEEAEGSIMTDSGRDVIVAEVRMNTTLPKTYASMQPEQIEQRIAEIDSTLTTLCQIKSGFGYGSDRVPPTCHSKIVRMRSLVNTILRLLKSVGDNWTGPCCGQNLNKEQDEAWELWEALRDVGFESYVSMTRHAPYLLATEFDFIFCKGFNVGLDLGGVRFQEDDMGLGII